jgi:glycosyltransferase involved in cell wall biosynthesis
MKIYMIGAAAPVPPCGGVETTIMNLSAFLQRTGHDVTNICYDKKSYEKTTEIGKIISLKQTRHPFINKFLYNFKAAGEVKKLLPKNEDCIIHGHADNAFGYAMNKGKAPFLTTFQGNAYITYKLDFREAGIKYRHVGFFKSNAAYIYEKYFKKYFFSNTRYMADLISAKKSDLIVACSDKVKREIVELYGVERKKVEVIYNGVNREVFNPIEKDKAKSLLGLKKNKKYGLWVGVVPVIKGLDIAVDAVKNMGDVELLAVGWKDWGGLNVFEKVKNVKFLGGALPEKLNLLYNAADFFILPSRYDAFGIVIAEAMACGTPVIISKNCGASEIVKDGKNGFALDGLNPESYRGAIEYLLNDETMMRKMSKNCIKTANEIGWDKQGEKYLNVYKRLSKGFN